MVSIRARLGVGGKELRTHTDTTAWRRDDDTAPRLAKAGSPKALGHSHSTLVSPPSRRIGLVQLDSLSPRPVRFRASTLKSASRFVRAHGVGQILGGLLLSRHFEGRYVLWVGGWPKPKIINRGGRLQSGGCALWNGVRLEVGPGALLSIGKGTYLNRNTVVVCHERVEIGANCLVSWDVVIMDTNEHDVPESRRNQPIRIGDRVWIGCRAIILPGVTIGSGSVIGAGSIVTRDIPENSLAVGQPARVIRCISRAPSPLVTGFDKAPHGRR